MNRQTMTMNAIHTEEAVVVGEGGAATTDLVVAGVAVSTALAVVPQKQVMATAKGWGIVPEVVHGVLRTKMALRPTRVYEHRYVRRSVLVWESHDQWWRNWHSWG